jgi:hypothetical protein
MRKRGDAMARRHYWHLAVVVSAVLFSRIILPPAAVQAAPIQLTWDAPTNADSTPLTALAGYKVYYGEASED